MKKLILFLLLINSNNLYGGTRRPEVPDSEYIAYGNQYNCVVKLSGQLKENSEITASGSAVVIGENWILSAAHVVGCMDNIFFEIKGKKYFIKETIVNKEFDPNSNSISPGDLALCYVEELIEISFFPKLYEKEDEENKICGIAGYGYTGTGITGSTSYDGKKRAGSNKISLVTDSILFCNMSEKNPTSLEFLAAHGDSGGGLFIEGKLAGINSFVSSTKGRPMSKFGDESGHTRISKYKFWIENNIKFHKKNYNKQDAQKEWKR